MTQANVRALRLFAEHVESLDPDDQLLAALAEAQREGSGNPDGDRRWKLSPKVLQVLAHAGRDLQDQPKAAELLAEVVRYAVADGRKALREGLVANTTARAQQERQALKATEERVNAEAQAKVAKWKQRFHHAEAELTDLRKERSRDNALVEGAEKAMAQAQAELTKLRKERDQLRALVEGEKSKPEPQTEVA